MFRTLSLLMLTLAMAATPTMAQDGAASVSAWSGVYTREQADRGKSAYFKSCPSCHGGTLAGGDGGNFDGPPLTGKDFREHWRGAPLSAIYEFMMTQMPRGAPGSLSRRTYADILAFVLSRNGAPAGESELPADQTALDKIIFGDQQNP
jgi:mono/diheme cytochrome c family protein